MSPPGVSALRVLMVAVGLLAGFPAAVPAHDPGSGSTVGVGPAGLVRAVTPRGSLLRTATTWHTFGNLRYSLAGSGAATSLDLYVPDNGADRIPVIVWIHGGGWSAGSKDDDCIPRDKGFMSRGFAVACINYRLVPDALWPAQIIDVKTAVRALRANATRYGIYPDKIGVWGASAGGHLAAMAGAAADVPEWDRGPYPGYSSRVQAVVDDFGPTDLLNGLHDPCCARFRAGQELVVDALLGGSAADHAELARAASPVDWVDRDAPPFQIWHGTRDELVPPSQSRDLADRLRAANVPVRLVLQPGLGHGDPRGYGEDRIRTTAAFFDSWLRPDS